MHQAQSTAKVDRIDMLDHIVIHVRGKLTGVAFACFLLETLRDFTSKGKVGLREGRSTHRQRLALTFHMS